MLEYAVNEKHVYPTSPTTFHSYLNTVALGLRGLRLEKQAEKIVVILRQLSRDLESALDPLGRAINQLDNARSNLGNVQRFLSDTQRTITTLDWDKTDEIPTEENISNQTSPEQS